MKKEKNEVQKPAGNQLHNSYVILITPNHNKGIWYKPFFLTKQDKI